MANEGNGPKVSDAAASAAKTGTDASVAMGKTAVGAASQIGQTAASAANSMTRTATDAATGMGRAAMDSMSVAGTMPGMADFTKMFSEMKMPGMPDMEALLSAHRRNLETLTTANRVALEGAQAVARRHMEIVQQNMTELTEGMRQLTSNEPPQAKAARQAEILKSSYERAVNNMRELSDLIQRSNGEALSVLNKRFTEAMDEARTLMGKTTES